MPVSLEVDTVAMRRPWNCIEFFLYLASTVISFVSFSIFIKKIFFKLILSF